MVTIVNEASIAGESIGRNASRKRLLTRDRVPSVRVLADRMSLRAESACELNIPGHGLAWIQVLGGRLTLSCGDHEEVLGETHVVLLPPGSASRLASSVGAELLYAEVPHAAEIDPEFTAKPPAFKTIDWSREPVLDSKHDSRKRVYVATPKLFGTKAIKAEIISYPKATSGSNHHHEGAEHFMYVISGSTTGYSNEEPHRYRAGDLVHHPDGERHYSVTDEDEEYRFVEFFVPSEYKTVWQNANRVCTWLPTGKDSRGGTPSREIGAHDSQSAAVNCPDDI
jgi:quercetin dioxygenase-like cupin family protein